MDRRLTTTAAGINLAGVIRKILVGLPLWLAVTNGQSLPEGRGRTEFQRICGKCHGVELVIKQHQSAEQWSATVDDMVGRGAEGTDDEFELVVKYLAANFGKDKAGSASDAPASQKININTASGAEIAAGLNLSKRDAEAIVQYRTEKGEFKQWSDLQKVPGIDLKRLEEQKDRIVFGPARTPSGDPK
jgi:competence ComEA-like helix-hairpin-helix protein